MSKTVIIRMNGVRAAYLASMGKLASPEHQPVIPAANNSASIIIKEEPFNTGKVLHNVLFDCGEGVVRSMVDFGLTEVTHCFLTHNHLDHILGLDTLVVTQRSSGGKMPLPVYASEGSWADGPARAVPWLCGIPTRQNPLAKPSDRVFPPLLEHQAITGFQPVDLDLGINLQVTPIPVYHGPSGFGPHIYVAEFGEEAAGTRVRIGFFWDMLNLIPRYPWEEAVETYAGPTTESDAFLPEHEALLTGIDEVFIDSSFLTPLPHIGHRSLSNTLGELLPRMKPGRVWVTHYDGSLDPMGTLSRTNLAIWIEDRRREFGLEDIPVEIADHGMTLSYTV